MDPYTDTVSRLTNDNTRLITENYKLRKQLRSTRTNFILLLMIIIGINGLLFVSQVKATTFKVAHDGDVNGYFISGRALFDNNLTILGNGPDASINNHTSVFMDKTSFGNWSAGNTIVFMDTVTTTNRTWYSEPYLNDDGMNHLFYRAFTLADGTPTVLVGFEDLNRLGDRDYDDIVVAFTNVTALEVSPVPEPSIYLMFISGLLLLGYRKVSRLCL